MKKAFLLLLLITSSFAYGSKLNTAKLYSTDFLPHNARVEITIKTIDLAAKMNDHNTFFLGDNDFEMIMTFSSYEYFAFPLEANRSNRNKHHTLGHTFSIPVQRINLNIKKRIELDKALTGYGHAYRSGQTGQLCMLDDSLLTPSFLTTSYYGCFDLASTLQRMDSIDQEIKYLQVEKETTFPAPKDPKDSKKIKILYEVRLLK